MLHDAQLSGAGATILIPMDRYPQVFSTTHLVILPYVIYISSCFVLISVFSGFQKTPLLRTPT